MSKKPFTVILRTPADVKRAQAIVARSQVAPESPLEVIIRPYQRTRSQEQNRLLWKWYGIVEAETGQDVESLHMEMKRRFLVPILRRDDLEFNEMVESVIELRKSGHHEAADRMRNIILQMQTTTSLKVKQMTEYLEHIERFAGEELGITLARGIND